MPIINLQRKLTEVGRIRLGAKSEKGAPTKLDKFRLTSKSRDALEAAAEVYGGTVKAWNSPDGDAFELITTTNVLDVVVPPGNALSQWYEMWSGAGCQRRCDGQTETIGNRPCLCPADQAQRSELSARGQACRPTTRLSVLLPKVKTVGIWRLESHGYFAATELAGIAELLQQVSATDRYLPATLRLEQRSARRQGKLSRFAVPVLEVGATVQEAIEAVAGGSMPAIESKVLSSYKPEAPMPEPSFEEAEVVVIPAEVKPVVVKQAEPEPVATPEPDLGWEEPIIETEPVVQAEPVQDNPFELGGEPVQRKALNYVQRIQILRRELGLTEAQYRSGLKRYGVESSKDLTEIQAKEMVDLMAAAVAQKKAKENG
jgi:hypothetical protein